MLRYIIRGMSKYEKLKPAATLDLKQGIPVEKVAQSHDLQIELVQSWADEITKDGGVVEVVSGTLLPKFKLWLDDSKDETTTEDKCKILRGHILETARRNLITAANTQGDKLMSEALAVQAKGLLDLNKLVDSYENSSGNRKVSSDFSALEDADTNTE